MTINTQTDTYEQAIAAVQAAYEHNPRHRHEQLAALPPRAIPGRARGSWAAATLGDGWTERMLFDTIAAAMPGARAVLRRLVELGATAS
ncbi:hypothetical protein [Streptomyces canus]|uniref:hypothetical protein n=1 Tax=Streptomyces canus TaxID=58343 RepID=UPI00224FE316|nr:hypothetical protein [Streptomyces canus]MCX4853915.1 hypothetical protein [Streptomyces canus]